MVSGLNINLAKSEMFRGCRDIDGFDLDFGMQNQVSCPLGQLSSPR